MSSYLTRIPILHLVTAASCPITVHLWGEVRSAFPTPSVKRLKVLPASPCMCSESVPPPSWPPLSALTAVWYGPAGIGEPRTGLQLLSHKCEMEGRDHSPLRTGCTLASTVQYAAGHLHCKGKLVTFNWLNLRIPGEHILIYPIYNILSSYIIRCTKYHFVNNWVM